MIVSVKLRAEGTDLPTIAIERRVDVADFTEAMDVMEELANHDEWETADDVEKRATLLSVELRKVGESQPKQQKVPKR